jgi:hypothetical protein
MSLEWQFFLSVIVYYFVFVVFLKALRDIIKFRFKWSILDNIKKKWLRNYLLDKNPKAPTAVDGWHQGDGGVVLFPLALIIYWGNRLIYHAPWWQVGIALFLISWLFYIVFNLLYHYLLMKKGFKGRKVDPTD